MTSTSAEDAKWLRWVEIQKGATLLWMQGDAAKAIHEINHFLASEVVPDLRRDALTFRGHIYDDQGDPDSARADLLSALEIAEKYLLERYSIEISLAALCVRQGKLKEAERWALSALQTAAADPKTSGAGALQKLITIRGAETFSTEERKLIKKVVHQAWSLLRVEGQPDLAALDATTTKLLRAHRGPFSAERPPTPKAYEEPVTED